MGFEPSTSQRLTGNTALGVRTFALVLTLVITQMSFGQTTGTAGATLNFRASPNGRDLGTNVRAGEQFTILKTTSSWVQVRRSNGKTGWIWKKYVRTNEKEKPQVAPQNILNQPVALLGELKNVRTSLNVRSRPSARSGEVDSIRPGEEFEILGTAQNGWYKVKTASGKIGYASDQYISSKAAPNIDGFDVNVGGEIPTPSPAVRDSKDDEAERSRQAGIRLEAMKELRAQNLDREVAAPASLPVAKNDDHEIEADCKGCLAHNEVNTGPTRALLDIGSKVAKYHKQPRIVPIIAGQCQIGDRYGMRRHPILGYKRMHDGQDVKTNRTNVPLRSPMKGVVVTSGRAGGYGWQIKITLENGVTVSYNHMQKKSKFKPGDVVEPGTVVGKSGSTGLSTGIHLHLETFDSDGRRFDPLRVFKRSEICGAEQDPVPPTL